MNQNPEQAARDNIDKQLERCGWIIQNKKRMNLYAGQGVAVREYQTDAGPADYILFVDHANSKIFAEQAAPVRLREYGSSHAFYRLR